MGAPAHADAGLPMLAVYWPVAWFALFLIVPFEAFIGRRYVGFDGKQAIKISLYANLISTLLGIPMAWLVMLGVEMAASLLNVLPGLPSHSLAASVAYATLYSAWFLPTGPEDQFPNWVLPVAMIFFCIPSCLVSVWSEYQVARDMLPEEESARALRWSWLANVTSYCIIILVLVGALVFYI